MLQVAWALICAVAFVVTMYVMDVRSGAKRPLLKAIVTIIAMSLASFLAVIVYTMGNAFEFARHATPPRLPARPDTVIVAPKAGLDRFDSSRHKLIFRSATQSERTKESLQKSLAESRERGIDFPGQERLVADLEAQREKDIVRLCDTFQLSRDEIEKIIAEGKEKKW